MAMSVSPGSRSSPGFCHNRRQGKRSAQKQIICPIYRGSGPARPYRLGLEPTFFARSGRMNPTQKLRSDSLLESYLNTANLARIWAAQPRRRRPKFRILADIARFRAYSAAKASSDLGFADETMKSWMRGTISDLKREPLNTP